MACLTVTDATFQEDVITGRDAMLVDFWADWCGPCRLMGPALDELSVELGSRLRITKLNIDQNPKTTEQYNIKSVPTLVLFRDGNVIATKVGPAPKGQIKRWIEEELDR